MVTVAGHGRRRPRRTRRASPRRTGAPSPGVGTALPPETSSATTSDLSTSRLSWSMSWYARRRCWRRRLGQPPDRSRPGNRQPAEQTPFGLGQQRMRPVDRGAQGLVAAHRGARTPGQQSEPVVEMSTICASESARTRAAASSIASGMPSRRRQMSAMSGRIVVGDAEIRPGATSTVGEQFDRLVGQRQ